MAGESVTGGAYTGQPDVGEFRPGAVAGEQEIAEESFVHAVGGIGSFGADVRLDAQLLGDEGYDRAIRSHRAILDNLTGHEAVLAQLPPGGDMREPYHRVSFGRSVHYLRGLPQDQVTRGLFLMQPTNFGKTVYGANFLRAAGVGNGMRAVWLTDSADGVLQTVGRRDRPNPERKQGFLDFIPDVSVDAWTSRRHAGRLGSSIRAMTYTLFQQLSPQDRKRLWYMTDILACDEADCALGDDRMPKIKEFMLGKLTVFLSATDGTPTGQRHRMRKVTEVFNVPKVDGMSPREALGAGIINGCKIFFVADYRRKRKEEAKADMLPEADNPVLDIVAYEAERYGHRGFVMTERGSDKRYDQSAQARHLADRLNETRIVGQKTGEWRNLRAAAIGTFLEKGPRRSIRDQYEAGELDVLVASDMLIRGVDSALCDFLVAARDVESPTVMTQFFGRGARYKDHLTRCYQIINPDAPRFHQLFTFLHVLDVQEDTRVLQGIVLGRPGILVPQDQRQKRERKDRDVPESSTSDESGSTRSENEQDGMKYEEFPEELRDAIEGLQGRILSEIVGLATNDVPDTWPTATELLDEFGFGTRSALLHNLDEYVADEPGDDLTAYPYVLAGREYRVNPMAVGWLRQHKMERADPDVFVSLREMCARLGTTDKVIRSCAAIVGISLEERRHADPRINMPILGLTSKEFVLLEAYFAENYSQYDPRVEISISDIARALNRTPRGVALRVDSRNRRYVDGEQLGTHIRRTPRHGRCETCLPALSGRAIMTEMGRRMSEDAVLIDAFSAEKAHALTTSPYRWRVIHQFPDYREQPGRLWLPLNDHELFINWLAGSRQAKSASGMIEDRVGLSADEFSRLDHALFHLGSPVASQGLPPELAQQIAPALLRPKGLRKLQSWEQGMLGNLLIKRQSALEIVFGQLVPAGKVRLPNEPHVTDIPQFLGEQLDNLLVDMMKRM